MWNIIFNLKITPKKEYLKIILPFFICGALFLTPTITRAANLGLSPATLSKPIGNTFSATVYVASADKAINAVSGIVSFPADKLEITGLSKAGSIINLWVQEPTFSNSEGAVNFEGIALNPGYTGNYGTIITITFKAKSAGQANINFSSGSVLANDGAGTNILDRLGSASFSLQDSGTATPDTPPATNIISGAPVISSLTHPDQKKWYQNNSPELSWQLPPGALEVRTLIGKVINNTPTTRYTPPISKKKIDPLPDGTYYFSLQIRTAKGWSKIGYYQINIDTTPPNQFSITFPHGKTSLEPQPIILFNTTDDLSGIAGYEIKIGDNDLQYLAPPATTNPYLLPPQNPGTRLVSVTAIDEAGNTRSVTENFVIEPIKAPLITAYPEEVETGDIIKIRGTTYPNSKVDIIIKEKNETIFEESGKSNDSGDWVVIITKRLSPGAYDFTVSVTDERQAKSAETTPLTIVINSKLLTELTELVLNYLSLIILIILLFTGIVCGGMYLWYHSIRVVRRFRRESREAEKTLEKSFQLLRQDIHEHITRLKTAKSKRQLSTEEIAFLEKFDKELAAAKEEINKEVQDISHS